MNAGEGKPSGEERRLKWWRRFWPPTIISCLVLIVVQCILYLLGYIDLFRLYGGILLVFVVIPLIYAIWCGKTRISIETQLKMNRIAFIGAGACGTWAITFFGGAFIIWVAGLPSLTAYMGPWLTFIAFFIVPLIVGGLIGDWLGKKRDYRPLM